MQCEKELGNFKWYSCEDLKFRIKKINDEISIVWVVKESYDIFITLLMYDFLDYCQNELFLYIEVDSSWPVLNGFLIKSSELEMVMQEMLIYTRKWKIESNENYKRITDDEWYYS